MFLVTPSSDGILASWGLALVFFGGVLLETLRRSFECQKGEVFERYDSQGRRLITDFDGAGYAGHLAAGQPAQTPGA